MVGIPASSVAEPCHFDTVPVLAKVPTSYFPSYGSGSGSCSGCGSGSLHNFSKTFKIMFLSIIFLMKLDGNRLILTWNVLLL
jgi:hypothetical protein